jgi:hypothetical protein
MNGKLVWTGLTTAWRGRPWIRDMDTMTPMPAIGDGTAWSGETGVITNGPATP